MKIGNTHFNEKEVKKLGKNKFLQMFKGKFLDLEAVWVQIVGESKEKKKK